MGSLRKPRKGIEIHTTLLQPRPRIHFCVGYIIANPNLVKQTTPLEPTPLAVAFLVAYIHLAVSERYVWRDDAEREFHDLQP
jgi:hypothetical protein